MKKAFRKNIWREIMRSKGRYFAIMAIIALGVGFFSGLKITKDAMITTGVDYIESSALFDIRLISTLGLTESDVEYFTGLEYIKNAQGAVNVDTMANITLGNESAGKIIRFHSLTDDINLLQTASGRLPLSEGECIIDARFYDESYIGSKITVTEENDEDTLNIFKAREYTIVGTAYSAYYINTDRGNTSLGDGTVDTFVYIPIENFSIDYFTEIFLTINSDAAPYSDEYDSVMDDVTKKIQKELDKRGQIRLEVIKNDAEIQLADARTQYNDGVSQLSEQREEAAKQFEEAEKVIEQGWAEYNDAIAMKDVLVFLANTLQAQLTSVNNKLENPAYSNDYDMLLQQKADIELQYNTVTQQISDMENGTGEIGEIKKALEDGESELAKQKADAENLFADAERELSDARSEIDQAQEALLNLKTADGYVLTREQNAGYVSYESDAAIVDGISRVFPVFFFMVAVLVCTTTMTRMVDEQRTQIGTLKALGYSNGSIIMKYVVYSGSSALIGTIVGYFFGTKMFPLAIWSAYKMLYGFGEIEYVFSLSIFLISIAVALLCSAGTTFITCRRELTKMPSELMRPKSPKAGKRVLLERIPFIWRRLGFLHKVSVRNIFRYKKRMLMMMLGVGGCTALMLTGFGIRDSISNIAEFQFDDIMKYDYTISFDKGLEKDEQLYFEENADGYLGRVVFVTQKNATADTDSGIKSVNIIASDTEGITELFDLHNGAEKISYPKNGETVINTKLAKMLGVGVGDTVEFKFDDTTTAEFKVSGICENYVYNYAFMTAQTYSERTGNPLDYNTAYANAADGREVHEVSAYMMKNNADIINISITADVRATVDSMMTSLNSIVWLVIASAAMLALIVLVNLSNINITERIREIATIKVLGFYNSETSAYVFRENIILTGFGAAAGLLLGVVLHSYVMSQINVDMVSFRVAILPLSYVYSVILTFAFALLTSRFMRRKLNKINMAESLKSIE